MIDIFLFLDRLVGVQGLLEDMPTRRKGNMQLWLSSPGESKSMLRRGSKNVYNVKEELSSKNNAFVYLWKIFVIKIFFFSYVSKDKVWNDLS